jgi:hypothetical protein
MNASSGVTAKRNYAPPQLSKYGSLTDMTAAAGHGNRTDNTKGKSATKT